MSKLRVLHRRNVLFISVLSGLFLSVLFLQGQLSFARSMDAVLVIDGSGSMRTTDPERLRVQGANIFVHLSDESDQIGVVEFYSGIRQSQPLLGMDESGIREVRNVIDNVTAGGYTNIKIALEKALGILERGDPTHAQTVILLTDGETDLDPDDPDSYADVSSSLYQEYRLALEDAPTDSEKEKVKQKYKAILIDANEEKLRGEVLPKYREEGVQIFTVGLSEYADRDLLEEIASETRASDRAAEKHSFFAPEADQLVFIFSMILRAIKGLPRFRCKDEIGTAITTSVDIDDTVEELILEFTFRQSVEPSEVSINITNPHGNLIPPITSGNVVYYSEPTYRLYRVTSPAVGQWNIRVTATSPVHLRICFFGKSELDISLHRDFGDSYEHGESVPIEAVLTRQGETVSPPSNTIISEFTAHVTKPNGQTESIILYDDGSNGDQQANDGIYTNLYGQTGPPTGQYGVVLRARGITSAGHPFIREKNNLFFSVLHAFWVEDKEATFKIHPPLPTKTETKNFTLNTTSYKEQEVKLVPSKLGHLESDELLSKNHILVDESVLVSYNNPREFSLQVTIPEGQVFGLYEGDLELKGKMGKAVGHLPIFVDLVDLPRISLSLEKESSWWYEPVKVKATLSRPDPELPKVVVAITRLDEVFGILDLLKDDNKLYSGSFKTNQPGKYIFSIQPSSDYIIEDGEGEVTVSYPPIDVSYKKLGRLRPGKRYDLIVKISCDYLFHQKDYHVTVEIPEEYQQYLEVVMEDGGVIRLTPNQEHAAETEKKIAQITAEPGLPWFKGVIGQIVVDDPATVPLVLKETIPWYIWIMLGVVITCALLLVWGFFLLPKFTQEMELIKLTSHGVKADSYHLRTLQKKRLWKTAVTIGSVNDDIDGRQKVTVAKLLPRRGGDCDLKPLVEGIKINGKEIEKETSLPNNSVIEIKNQQFQFKKS